MTEEKYRLEYDLKVKLLSLNKYCSKTIGSPRKHIDSLYKDCLECDGRGIIPISSLLYDREDLLREGTHNHKNCKKYSDSNPNDIGCYDREMEDCKGRGWLPAEDLGLYLEAIRRWQPG